MKYLMQAFMSKYNLLYTKNALSLIIVYFGYRYTLTNDQLEVRTLSFSKKYALDRSIWYCYFKTNEVYRTNIELYR